VVSFKIMNINLYSLEIEKDLYITCTHHEILNEIVRRMVAVLGMESGEAVGQVRC
jgi:hypothetical protein